jgi:acetyltransferase-like isoleucine patch superfamily enzyme
MLSITIPVFNKQDLSYECIQTVLDTTTDCEIIVVDNGSNPPFKPPFGGFTEITVIRNEENTGFPHAVNQGIKAAKGDTIVLLNNDVFVTPGCLNRLDNYISMYNIDIIGPCTNYCAGIQRVQLPVYNSLDQLNTEAGYFYEENKETFTNVNWVIGFCMMFKKSLYDELGEFDESLWPCSGEEIDFCFRAKEKGYSIAIANDTYVHHEGSKTFEIMGYVDEKYTELCNRNDTHLANKWGANFWQNQAVVEDKREAKEPIFGDYTYVDGTLNITFSDAAQLTVGKFCSIAQGCNIILGGNHRGDWISTYPFPAEGLFINSPNIPVNEYRTSKGDVNIGNDVWIGSNVTILSGVTIGDGAIIAAGSVVSKNVDPYTMVAGNPAVVKKLRFTTNKIQRLLEIKWWDWPEDEIRKVIPILMSGDVDKFFKYCDEREVA